MKRSRTVTPVVPFLLLAFVGTNPGESSIPRGVQQTLPDASQDVSGPTMVFEREVFTYPAGERRNPFLPLGGTSANSPRAEDVRLLGIIHHPDSAYSLVVLGVSAKARGGGDVPDSASAPRLGRVNARLRLGGRLGRLRIAAIHQDHVVVEADESDRIATRVLTIPRPAGGRGS